MNRHIRKAEEARRLEAKLRALAKEEAALPTTPEKVKQAEAWLEANPIELPESLRTPPFHLLDNQRGTDDADH